jgi:anti-anti-sigma factor
VHDRIDGPASAVAVRREGGDWVVVFDGDLDLATAGCLWDRIVEVRRSGRPLVLDLSRTRFMDSSGLKVLLRAYTEQGRVPEAVVLRAPGRAVREVLELAGVCGLFRIEHLPATAATPAAPL